MTAETVLRLPSCQIGIEENISLGNEPGADPDHQHQALLQGVNLTAKMPHFFPIKEFGQSQTAEKTKQWVISSEKGRSQGINATRRQ